MAFHFPSDHPYPRRVKPKLDLEAMFSGLLMGVTALGFATCLLVVLNGKAGQRLRAWMHLPAAESAAAPPAKPASS